MNILFIPFLIILLLLTFVSIKIIGFTLLAGKITLFFGLILLAVFAGHKLSYS